MNTRLANSQRTDPLDWIGTAQAAAILGVSAQTVQNLANRGKLDHIRVSGKGGYRIYFRPVVEALRREREAAR